nr:alpha/beta fold hydrolase [Sediminivirga luteola]
MAGGTAVVRLSDPDLQGEIFSLDTASGAVTQLTRHWEEELPEVSFLPARPVSFTISDGTRVHGWLLRDPATQGPAPTLLDIHGGPHNAWTGVADAAHLYQQVLAARGWNVLTLNPRASDGYGEEFFTAAVGAWGEADEQDFLEPLDTLADQGLVDPQRVAVTGYSYGGFMTCWLSSRHPERFAAAVPGGLVSELHTLAASSDLGRYLRDIETGAGNAERLSPASYVDAVTAPTLVLHGQEDQRCPLAQGELWYSRLQENGVPSRMVVYPGGSHLFILNGPVSHRVDYNQRIIDWVVEHTQASSLKD